VSPAIRDLPNPDIASHRRHSADCCARVVRTDRLEASKVDGSYADHNNKITVAECARDWVCDPLGIAAKRGRS
jgi:hypothetical protein